MEDWKYLEARKRVQEIKRFYQHFATWVVFSAFFIFLNVFGNSYEFWAIFPIAGWGVGVAMHAIRVFGFPGLGRDWEERLLQREIERLDREEEIKEWVEDFERNLSPSSKDYPDHDPGLQLRELDKLKRDSEFV